MEQQKGGKGINKEAVEQIESGGKSNLAVIDPWVVLGLAVGIGIGHYSIFHLIFEKNFVERYKKFKDAFEQWMIADVGKFYSELESMIKEQTQPAELIDFVKEWATRQSEVLVISNAFTQLSSQISWIIISVAGASLFGILQVAQPDTVLNPSATSPIYWINVALFSLAVAIFLIFRYIYEFHKLSTKITEFELGKPISEVLTPAEA